MPTYKLAARKGDTHKPSTIVRIGNFARIGGDAVALIVDVLQIGARNMRDRALLDARKLAAAV